MEVIEIVEAEVISMVDVTQKIISGNAVQQGCAISYTDKKGNIHSLCPTVTAPADVAGLDTKLTNRFDDTDYYGTKFKPTIISGCQVWVSADKITGLVDGDTVTTWSDQTSNSNDFTQITASKKPVYKTNIFKQKPALKFDGSDDFMLGTPTGLSSVTDFSIFAAISFITEGDWMTPLSIGDSGAGNPMIRFFQLNNAIPLNIRVEGKDASNVVVSLATGSNVSIGKTYVGSAINDNGVNISQYLNSVLDASHTSYDINSFGTITRFTLGGSNSEDTHANCYIAEVIFYNRKVTEKEQSRVQSYLSKKYEVAVP